MFRIVIAAAVLAAAPAHAQPSPRQGPPPGGAHERLFISPSGEPFRGEDGLAAWFSGADADLNQRVSRDEWAKAARRRFELLDTDQDGKLTLETLRPRLAR